jgi:hypothetical protein
MKRKKFWLQRATLDFSAGHVVVALHTLCSRFAREWADGFRHQMDKDSDCL